MIDIHTHLLPNTDDGVKTKEEAIALIKQAIEDGITDICLTPHFSRVDEYVCKKEKLLIEFNNLKETLKDLDINIYLGNELMIEQNLDSLLENNELCTINNSKYVLVEFPLDEYKKEYDEYLYNISSLGLKIIIAHPERYQFISDELIDKWLKQGYILQSNARSLLRPHTKKLVFKLIEEGKISLFASDAHNELRPSLLKEEYELVSKKFDKQIAELLFVENPRNILNNLDIIKPQKIKKKLF